MSPHLSVPFAILRYQTVTTILKSTIRRLPHSLFPHELSPKYGVRTSTNAHGESIMLKSKITLSEENDHLVLDITDNTGGLGLKLYFSPNEANNLGQGLIDRARFMVAKAGDDPKRTEETQFNGRIANA